MAKLHAALTLVLSLLSVVLLIMAVLPDTPWYHTAFPYTEVTESWRSVMNGEIKELRGLFNTTFFLVVVGGLVELGLALLLIVSLAHRDWVPSDAQVIHKWCTRGLAIGALIPLMWGVIYFIRHNNALSGSALCNIQQGPCLSWKGSAPYGSWGPRWGWTVSLWSSIFAFLAMVVSWTIHSNNPYIPLNPA